MYLISISSYAKLALTPVFYTDNQALAEQVISDIIKGNSEEIHVDISVVDALTIKPSIYYWKVSFLNRMWLAYPVEFNPSHKGDKVVFCSDNVFIGNINAPDAGTAIEIGKTLHDHHNASNRS